MKRTTLLLTLAVIFTGCGPAEENSGTGGSTGAGPKDTVRKAAEAIKAGDAATLKNLYIHTADGGRTFPKMKECGTAPTLEQAVADGDRARGG